MNKKKAIICTVLFTIVVVGAIAGTMLIKNEFFKLYDIVANSVFVIWVSSQIVKFYNWLQEE